MSNVFWLMTITVVSISQLSCQKRDHAPSKIVLADPSPASQVPKPKGIDSVADYKELPICDNETQGAVVYVESEPNLYHCKEGQWKTIQIQTPAVVTPEPISNQEPSIVSEHSSDKWRQIWADNIESVAFIVANYGDVETTGTGFVVADGIIATNGHVVAKEATIDGDSLKLTSVEVYFPEDIKGDTKRLNRSGFLATAYDRTMAESRDIALVQVDTGGRRHLTLATKDEAPDHLSSASGVTLQQEMLLIGYSTGTTFAQFTTGRINAIQEVSEAYLSGFADDGSKVYLHSAISGSGSSGGPVLDENGEVIAVNFAGYTSESDVEFGIGMQVGYLRSLMGMNRSWQPNEEVDEP